MSNLFTAKNGRIVELEWADDEMVVWTTGHPRERIGSICFRHVEWPSDGSANEYYLVTNMYLDGPNGSKSYLNFGIGREVIRRVGEMMPVAFHKDDGNVRDDGGHPTEMGPGFARKMVEENLAYFDD